MPVSNGSVTSQLMFKVTPGSLNGSLTLPKQHNPPERNANWPERNHQRLKENKQLAPQNNCWPKIKQNAQFQNKPNQRAEEDEAAWDSMSEVSESPEP